ncbi:helix-turn-helix transcriptional regulator [Myxacorys almedinensis]|uniref:Helix-turn-helix domain-containing protein n=1 Tax=Myxacorys almedinensis A TaxID=2690445 RepID=A0A8J7Z4F5_9CYAN|nr:AraC family transcriptional regulator [Myxacorys almedinensis]NDJ17918.1 helix-turn-helix domain-containing protein [Myxacorys almedinensis A]
MAITISRTDYDELWRACNPAPLVSSHSGYCEQIEVVPEQFGEGYIQFIQLREINLALFNYQLHHDLYIRDEVFGAAWEFGFNLSGNCSGKHTGENFIEWGAYEGEGTWITYANDPVYKVDVHLEAPDALFQLITETLEELPVEIRQHIEDCNRNCFDEINVITPAMRSPLEQIFNCPFQGKTKQIYLESKCLELIALKLEQIKATERSPGTLCLLKPDDVDRIYVAEKILKANLDHPPSLMELARQISLNDYKLKVGFQQVFGTTVFGYLHQHRMETARQLLTERRMNVREAAQAVGYANQSHFAAAFRKQFGVNPKAYVIKGKIGLGL